jgi:hypothetical protein
MKKSTEKQRPKREIPANVLPHVFKKGQSGNPAGRPPTKTLKEFARAYLAGLTDDERIEYFEGIDKKTIWEMAEGKPKQEQEIAGKDGQPIQIIVPAVVAQSFNLNAQPNTETGGVSSEQE